MLSPSGSRLGAATARQSGPQCRAWIACCSVPRSAQLAPCARKQQGAGRAAERFMPMASAGGGGAAGGSIGGSGSHGGGGGGSGSGGNSDSHPMQPLTYAFAALLAVGGITAYVKKKSSTSLGAGLGASLILALCARSMVGASMISSARVAFAMCTFLGILMGSRFSNSKKFIPAGLVALIALSMAGGFAFLGL